MEHHPEFSKTKYEVPKLTTKPYVRAVSHDAARVNLLRYILHEMGPLYKCCVMVIRPQQLCDIFCKFRRDIYLLNFIGQQSRDSNVGWTSEF